MAKVINSAVAYVPAPFRKKGMEQLYFGTTSAGDCCPVIVDLKIGKSFLISWDDIFKIGLEAGFIKPEAEEVKPNA